MRGRGGGGGGLRLPGGLGGGGGLPIPMGRGGGIGSIILLVIVFLVFGRGLVCNGDGGTGVDLDDIFGQVPAQVPEAQPGQVPTGPDPEAELVDFVSFVLDDTQNLWAQEFKQAGKQYERAELVLFRGQTGSGCGAASSATGPFYCPLNQTAYLDLGFFEELERRFGAPGDFAQAYVIAHEIGHHVQRQLGIEGRVREESQANPEEANDLSVRLELQADCLAGVWARSTYERKILEQGDLDEGLNAAAAIGDDRIQKQTQGRVDPESFTHGSSEQRMTWLRNGYEGGELESCDTFSGDV